MPEKGFVNTLLDWIRSCSAMSPAGKNGKENGKEIGGDTSRPAGNGNSGTGDASLHSHATELPSGSIPLGLLVVLLFLPGYALASALFPKTTDLGRIARTALSFCLGIAVVPLISLALSYTPWGIRRVTVVASLV